MLIFSVLAAKKEFTVPANMEPMQAEAITEDFLNKMMLKKNFLKCYLLDEIRQI